MATVKRPTLDQMKDIVASLHMSMSDREIYEYMEVMEGTLQAYDRLTQLPDNLPPVRYPRTPGYRPDQSSSPWLPASVHLRALPVPRFAAGKN